MHEILSGCLRQLEVTDERCAGSLQVFGLRWPSARRFSYVTLDEALTAATFEVTEVTEGGSVPLLKVVNRGDAPVFLMAGEQLVGAKQNRVLNTSILVPAHAELTIPVSCVEAGRWRYASPKFASAGTLSHGKLRKLLSGHVTESYGAAGWPASKQGEVWGEVSHKLLRMGSASPSAALQKTYEDHEDRLKPMLDSLKVPENCNGAAFAVDGQAVGADVFDQPATLARLWPKLVRAYAIDGLEGQATSKRVSPGEVLSWVRSAGAATGQTYKSPGLGHDVRLKGDKVTGSGLIVEEQPIHAEVFAV